MQSSILKQPEASATAERLFTTAFILVIGANLANALGAQMASAILPVYVVLRGGTNFRAGLVTGMLAFTALLLRPFVGWLADAWRRRPMVLVGTGCYTIANLMYALFGSLPLLLIGRVIHGFGLSNYSTGSSAFLADIAPPGRGRGHGLLLDCNGIGLLGGPALAFFLANYIGLQPIFPHRSSRLCCFPSIGSGKRTPSAPHRADAFVAAAYGNRVEAGPAGGLDGLLHGNGCRADHSFYRNFRAAKGSR